MAENKATILVVDDDEDVRELISRILLDAGYSVIEAASGEEALVKIDAAGIGLVLLDILMPGKNGIETLGLIRQKTNIPVIMVTAVSNLESVTSALKLGADDYIKKPFRSHELLARVQTKLRRKS